LLSFSSFSVVHYLFFPQNLIQPIDRSPQMRDRDRSTDDQRDVEGIHELFARHPNVGALFDVIGDAIVTSQNDRAGQSHQLFGLLVQRAVFVSLRIQRKETFDAEMAAAQQLLVHLSAIVIKVVHPDSPFRDLLLGEA